MATNLQGGQGTDMLAGGTYGVRSGRQGQMAGVDPRLVDILQTAAAIAPPGIGHVEAFSGKTGRSTGTRSHPGGRATDVQIYGPDGAPYARYVGNPFGAKAKANAASYRAYEQFAQVARQVQLEKYPELTNQFRWGGYFVGGVNPGDLMHFDLSGGLSQKTPPQTERWANGIGNGITVGAAALTSPVNVAAAQAPQSAIASLMAPSGDAGVPDMPTAAMGYAPNLPEGAPPAPPMPPVQMAAAPPPMPTLPPSWASGGFGQDVMLGGSIPPPMPRLRDQGTLDQQRADELDALLFGAGPHRGDFARGRPEGRWMEGAGGAPDAASVPIPSISPLAPAVAGPNDRRPQPPAPTMRPEGRWMEGAGGAPDAATVPNPLARGTPYAPAFPSLYGEQSAPFPPPMVAGRPEFPGALPAAPRAGDMSAAMGGAPGRPKTRPNFPAFSTAVFGQNGDFPATSPILTPPGGSLTPPANRVPSRTDLTPALMSRLRERQGIGPFPARPEFPGALPAAPSPFADPSRRYDIPGAATLMAEGMGVFEGPPLPPVVTPPRTPPIGNFNYSGPMPGALQPQTQGAVASPSMGFGPYGLTPPPASLPSFDFAGPNPSRVGDLSAAMGGPRAPYVPDFNFAPAVTADSPSGNVVMTREGAPSAPNWQSPPGVSGMTYAPSMPPPPPAMSQGMRDQFNVAFSPGGPGQIMDMPGIFAGRNAQPSPTPMPMPDLPFGAPPAYAGPQGDAGDIYDSGPTAANAAELRAATPPRIVGSPADAYFFSPQPLATVPAPLTTTPPVSAPLPTQTSYTPFVGPVDAWSAAENAKTFGGGSVVAPPSVPTPGVVQGTMPVPRAPMDIRPPVAGGPAYAPSAVPAPPRQEPPRQTNTGAERQKQGLAANILRAVFGGGIGSIIGGGGRGFGFGGGAAFTPFSNPMMNTGMGSFRTSGSAPYGNNGGSTNWQSGTSSALGGSNALSWTGSKGQPVTVVQDPWTGTYYGPTSP